MKLINIYVTLALVLGFAHANAQVPVVPKKMNFGGIELTISNSARADIQASVNRLHKNDKFFQNYVNLADLYFPVIEREFEKNNVPTDIKYLCIQESGFKADAVSSSDAVGYWQFKDVTGREQGLTVDKHVDERKNIVASSFSASKYLKSHNTRFGDNWVYSIIAYNTGFGGAQKYWNDKYAGVKKMDITKRTHWYFLKFLAHKIAFEGYVQKGDPETVLKIYEKTAGKTLKDYASEHGMPIEEVEKYNKWIKPNHKIPSDKVYSVVIPIAFDAFPEDAVADNEPLVVTDKEDKPVKHHVHEKKPDKSLRVPDSHKKGNVAQDISKSSEKNLRYKVNGVPAITAIESDDSDRLAIKGGIVRSKFLKFNEIKSFEELTPGQTYYLKNKKNKAKVSYHTAQYGETLWSIGQKYGVKKGAIRRKNRMTKTESLQPGRVLYLKSIRPEEEKVEYKDVDVPVSKEVQDALKKSDDKEEAIEAVETISDESHDVKAGSGETIHLIQKSETLYSISRLYHVTVDDIKECNNMTSDLLPASMKYLKICEAKRVDDIVERPDVNSSSSYGIKEEVDTVAVENVSDVSQLENVTYDTLKVEEKTTKVNVITVPEEKKITEVVEVTKPVKEDLPKTEELESSIDEDLDKLKSDKPVVTKEDSAKYILVLLEPGTTLYGLSRRFGVPMHDILEVNNLTDLQAGDTIKIPTTAEKLAEYNKEQAEEKKLENEIKFYTIKAGDTMYGVSKKVNMTVEDLKELNGKTSNNLTIGEVLKYKN